MVEQNVVSYVTIIDVPNPDLRLKPGMTANVVVEVAKAEAVLRVPNAALRVRPTPEVLSAFGQAPVPASQASAPAPGTHASAARRDVRPDDEGAPGRAAEVWVLADGRLAPVPLRAGISDGTNTAVFCDRLTEGDLVVTSIVLDAATASASTSPLLPVGRGRGAGSRGGAGPP